MDWGVPATVMARSVELGNMSPATCTWAPADCKRPLKHKERKKEWGLDHSRNIWRVRRKQSEEHDKPLWFPWSCSHPCQWESHTGWQAQQGAWWPAVCWWLYCSSLRCWCPAGRATQQGELEDFSSSPFHYLLFFPQVESSKCTHLTPTQLLSPGRWYHFVPGTGEHYMKRPDFKQFLIWKYSWRMKCETNIGFHAKIIIWEQQQPVSCH